MAKSLQEQLLEAGLASKQQAQKAGSERRRKRKRKGASAGSGEEKSQARQAQADKVKRDRELNLRRQQEADGKAREAQVRQLIESNLISRNGAEIPYNFVDGTSVCRIYVHEETQAQLGRGLLAVVKLGDGYEVVPQATADKLSERDSSVVMPRPSTGAPEDDDDFYAGFQVPDDLRW